MALGKRLIQTSGAAACNTETVTAFGADAAYSHNVALYQLDGNDNDTTGNYSGIAENNITYASGYIGNAAVFNGSSSSIELPNSSLGITDASNFSISYWFNTNSTTQDNQSVIWANGSNAGARFGSGINSPSQGGDTSIYFGMPVDGSFTYINSGTSAFTADTWVHVVGVKSSITGMSLYVNNVLKATNTSATGSASATATGKNSIGMYHTSSDSSFFNGEIDQLRIFNREITSSEVSTLYAETSSTASNTNPLGDGVGVALYSLDYDASDTSGLYDGTPTDVDFGVSGKTVNGARFNGSSSEIGLPVGLGASGDRAFSFWMKLIALPTSGTDTDTIIYIGNQSQNSQYTTINVNSSGTVRYQERHNTTGGDNTNDLLIESSTNISINQWVHIVIVFDGTTRNFYLNGSTSNGGTGTKVGGAADTSSFAGQFGSFRGVGGTFTLDGTIDQARFFSTKITPTQVATLYNSGNGEQACVHTATTTDVDFPVTNAAYYKFDNSAEDSKGTNDGTESNIEYRFGRYGQAAVFNGVETASGRSKITTSGLSTYNNFSISFWMNSDDLSNSTAALVMSTTDNNSSQAGFNIFTGFPANNNITWIVCNGSSRLDFTATANLTENQWHHIVITQNTSDNTKKIYIDGSLSGTSTSSTNVTGQGYSLLFGGYSTFNNNTYDGKLDQIRIFASELSAENVTSLYNEKPETDTSNFKTVLYEGTGASQYISNVGIDLETSGGLIWLKSRDSADNHNLGDSVRGVQKFVYSNLTSQELTSANYFTSFEKNGFFIGTDNSINKNNDSFVGWVWKGGGAAVSNGNGSIASSVSANTAAGFSIVSWTGSTSTSAETVGHGLSSAPELVILKNRDASDSWYVFANGVTSTSQTLKLDTNDAVASTSTMWGAGMTSTVAGIRPGSFASSSSHNVIMYCFHSVSGYSKISFYLGAGSGTRVYTTDDGTSSGSNGFKPSFVVIKNADTGGTYYDWFVFDTRRDDLDGDDNLEAYLLWNTNGAEVVSNTGSNGLVMENDGFTLDISASALNGVGDTFLFMAFK